jgi:hypothetical protein
MWFFIRCVLTFKQLKYKIFGKKRGFMSSAVTGRLDKSVFWEQIGSVLPKAEAAGLVSYRREVHEILSRLPGLIVEKGRLESAQVRSRSQEFRLRELTEWVRGDKTALAAARAEFKNKCWAIYNNAYDGELPVLLGSNCMRFASELISNFGVISSVEHGCRDDVFRTCEKVWEKYGLGRVAQEDVARRGRAACKDDVVRKGSILCERYWSVLLNDVAILGFVHAHRDCHVWDGEPRRPLSAPVGGGLSVSEFWDNAAGRSRVLAREIRQLAMAGCFQAADSREVVIGGRVFVCKDHEKADRMTLQALYEEGMLSCGEKRDVMSALETTLRPVDEDDGEGAFTLVRHRGALGGAGGASAAPRRPASSGPSKSGSRRW